MPEIWSKKGPLVPDKTLRVAGAVVLAAFTGRTVATIAGVLIAGSAPDVAPVAVAQASAPVPGEPSAAIAQAEPAYRARAAAMVQGEAPVPNAFCPECRPEDEGEAPAAEVVEPADLPLQLVATMEADDPALSMATLLDTERDLLAVYQPSDEIRDGVALLSVGRGHVLLSAGDQPQLLKFPEPVHPAVRANQRQKKQQKAKKGKFEIEGARDAIACVKSDCHVDRAFVRKLTRNPALLRKQGKFKPWSKNGKMQGFKVSRVRNGTLPRLLGLRNGDLLTSVNGKPLTSMDEVMKLYGKLKNASNIELEFQRKGKTYTREIEIS